MAGSSPVGKENLLPRKDHGNIELKKLAKRNPRSAPCVELAAFPL
jgi:hypothetical protein